MNFIWDSGISTTNIIVVSAIMAVCFLALIALFSVIVHRRIPLVLLIIGIAVFVFGFIINSVALMILGAAIIITVVIISLMINLGDLRKFLANPFRRAPVKKTAFKVEKIFDRDAMYKAVETAVLELSKTRTGAIITFEKNSSLVDVMKNGVIIKAPVSAELLETIFYPGTRLHDGAVIIHGNEIVAASVFFTPSTKAFAGKYGSRHRAAIGISEITDAITIVVSEETGRISLAVDGQLVRLEPSNFMRAFINYMDGHAA